MPIDLKKNIMFKFFNDISANSGVFERIDIGSEINITDHASEITGLVYNYTWQPDNGGKLIIKGKDDCHKLLMEGLHTIRGSGKKAKIHSFQNIINRQTGCYVAIPKDQDYIEIYDKLPRNTFRCHPHFACQPRPDKKELKEKRKRYNNGIKKVKRKKRRITPVVGPNIPTIGESDCGNKGDSAFFSPYVRSYDLNPGSGNNSGDAIPNPITQVNPYVGFEGSRDSDSAANGANRYEQGNRFSPASSPTRVCHEDIESNSIDHLDLGSFVEAESPTHLGDDSTQAPSDFLGGFAASSAGSPSGNNSAFSSVYAEPPSAADSNPKPGDNHKTEDESYKSFLSIMTDDDKEIISGSSVEGGQNSLFECTPASS